MRQAKTKIIFLVTEDWYFWSHRLPMARAARDAGFNVGIATRVNAHGDRIQAEGFSIHRLDWSRGSLSVPQFIRAVVDVASIYRKEAPDIVHHVALKPVVIGSLAAKLAGVQHVVNAMTGLGHLFTSRRLSVKILRSILRPLLKMALSRPGTAVLLQNNDDRTMLRKLGFNSGNAVVIRGSGIDIEHFQPLPAHDHPIVTAAFVGRMIEIKGIRVLIEAHRRLRDQGIRVRLLLVGIPDAENLGSISDKEIAAWSDEPDVEWLGHVGDVRQVWAVADIAVLPSIGGEGLPKCLLEAAACGRPIIATDVPGSREIAIAERNAIVVPSNNAIALCEALACLASSKNLREEYGKASRQLVESDMAQQQVAEDIVSLYRSVLNGNKSFEHASA